MARGKRGTGAKKGVDKANVRPRFDLPWRNPKSENNFKNYTDSEYIAKWNEYRKDKPKTEALWKNFQIEHGTKFNKDGLKWKPSDPKNPGEITLSMDTTARNRYQRELLATWWFGGDHAEISALKYKGVAPHHRTGVAELSSFLDPVIDMLKAPRGSKEFVKGQELLELGREVFKDSDYWAGNTKQNLFGLFNRRHLGKGDENFKGSSIHDLLYRKYGITAHSGSDPFSATIPKKDPKTKEIIPPQSRGILLPGDTTKTPTRDVLRNLALNTTRENTFNFTELIGDKGVVKGKGGKKRYKKILKPDGNNLIFALKDFLEYSDPLRDKAEFEVKNDPLLQYPDEKPELNWRQEALRRGPFTAPPVARSSWSAKRQAYAAMGQSPNPVMNVYGDTLGNVEDVLSFAVNPNLHTGAHLLLGTGQTLTNITAGLGIYFKNPNLVGRSTAANAYLGRTQQILGMQSEGIELSRQGKVGTDFVKFGTDFKTDVDIKLKGL